MKRSHSAVYGAAAEEEEICGLNHQAGCCIKDIQARRTDKSSSIGISL